MSIEQNKSLVRRQFERVVNRGELNVADATVAAAYFDHSAAPDEARGPESVKAFARRQKAAYPDAQVTIEDIIGEDDRVAVRVAMTGTPSGGGDVVTFRGTVWWRVADGKIVERWGGAFAQSKD